MVHGVGDELLGPLDHGGSAGSQIEMHIHVVDIGSSVDRDFVLGQLRLVVESRPVVGSSKDFCHLLNLFQLGVRFEHVFENLAIIEKCQHCVGLTLFKVLTISPVK